MIPGFLDPLTLSRLDEILRQIDDVDGQRTAGRFGARIKNNLQKRENHPQHQVASQLVHDAMLGSRSLRMYAFPSRVTPVRFAEYGPGMFYEEHMDAGVMPVVGGMLRTDVSFTLFLSDPDAYEGGELTLEREGVRHAIKGQPGDLFVYPAGLRHGVNRVKAGQRRVAIGWIQSLYPDPEQRRILEKLGELRGGLWRDGDMARHAMVNEVFVCLERMWSDT